MGSKAIFIVVFLLGVSLWGLLEAYSRQTDLAEENRDSIKPAFKLPSLISYPKDNPYSQTKYDLGKTLFFDPRLSKSNSLSCASCHNPSLSWTDGLALGVGHGHQTLKRKVPTLYNVAWGTVFFWDGRARTLEEQALGPIASEAEMNLPLPEMEAKLGSIREYAPLFEAAFPGEAISAANVAKAIATFERSILSMNAPFDRWIAGDETAISEQAKRGFLVFTQKGACVKCHSGWNFTNDSFADTGLRSPDEGRWIAAQERDSRFAFKWAELEKRLHDSVIR